ncbi:MAG TPA: ATP-binding protein [Polyangia bacterium]|jgi:signal transduction histidine kinase
MRLRHKLIALCVLVAAAPVATAGLLTVRWNQDALEAEIRARHEAVAYHAAQAVEAEVAGLVTWLQRSGRAIEWPALTREEAHAALRLAFALGPRVTLGATYDPDGALAVQSWAAADEQTARDFRAHAPVDRARAERGEVLVLSPVYGVRGAPRVAVALARDHEGAGRRVVALELELAHLAGRLARAAESARLTLIDGEGHVIVDTGALPAPPGADQRLRPVVRDFLARLPGTARRYAEGGRVTIAAYAPVGTLGWGVVVERDAAAAFAPARRMRLFTLGGTAGATVLAIFLAGLFARRLTRALGGLAAGARAFGAGQLETRVPVAGGDEIAELGATLNTMAGEIAASREEILRWNRELEQRVEERTAELKAAQAQLVQAQKLAGLGQLGAGVAHEINNPLAGIIGHVQLLLMGRAPKDDGGDRDAPSLRKIEEAARRASAIVQNLQRFSVQHAEAATAAVDLNRVLRDTVSLVEQAIRDQQIVIEWRLAAAAPRARGDAGQLAQVLLNLVQNARTAMKAGGGTLTLESFAAGAEVGFRVRDTGKGIAPEHRARLFEPFFTTKDEWSNVGLGLSVSYRIVADHGGRIAVESEVGHGSAFTVYLPGA